MIVATIIKILILLFLIIQKTSDDTLVPTSFPQATKGEGIVKKTSGSAKIMCFFKYSLILHSLKEDF